LGGLKFEGVPADEPAGPITQDHVRHLFEFAGALVTDAFDNGKCESVWISSPLVTPVDSYVYVVAKRQPAVAAKRPSDVATKRRPDAAIKRQPKKKKDKKATFGCMVLDRLASAENFNGVPNYEYFGWYNDHGQPWQWSDLTLEELFGQVHDTTNLLEHWDLLDVFSSST
jgi:hypothetical protein